MPRLGDFVGWREVAFALLSLTLLRMLPVALSLVGTGLNVRTVLFVGWFGPRGLASVVFALIAVETLEVDDSLRAALAIVTLTVTLSVLAHGLSADPLAQRYGRWADSARPTVETTGVGQPAMASANAAPKTAPSLIVHPLPSRLSNRNHMALLSPSRT